MQKLTFLPILILTLNKIIKHSQTIRPQKLTNCLSVFDHYVGLALKGLKTNILLI